MKLADGTMPGNQQRPDYGVEPSAQDVHALEVAHAERDRLLDLLDRLERIIQNGYMTPDQQGVWREAKSVLVEYSLRPKSTQETWVDRTGGNK